MVMTNSETHAVEEHFREEDWLDFARQVGNVEHRALVARHLEAGCPECEQTLRLWSAVLKVADQDSALQPPAARVRQAHRRFAGERAKGLGERLRAQVALVFDSFRQPQLAGMRSLGTSSRQLLYKAGRYTIRLQLEAAGRGGVSIIGQILDEAEAAGGLRDIAVRALAGHRTLDRAVTNRLGEFHLEPGVSASLQLAVDVPEIGTFMVTPARAGGGAPRKGRRPATYTGRGKQARAR